MITVEFTGTLTQRNEIPYETKDGQTKVKYELVLSNTTEQGYTDLLAVTALGQKAEEVKDIAIGDTFKVRGAVNTREWQGKYFTQVNLLNIECVGQGASPEAQEQKPTTAKSEKPAPQPEAPKDDLPF